MDKIVNGLQFTFVGYVAVDSGMLSITDPANWTNEKIASDLENNQFYNETKNQNGFYEVGHLDHAFANLGIVFPTTTGDGLFSVYTVSDNGNLKGYYVSAESSMFNDGI